MKVRDLKLLTAFVDGELSNRERKAVHRLLHRSSQARALLAQMQANSYAIKQLPTKTLPADFAEDVLAATQRVQAPTGSMEVLTLPPIPPIRSRLARRLAWAAALLLLATGSLALVLFGLPRGNSPDPPIAQNGGKTPDGSRRLRDLQQKNEQEELTRDLQQKPGVHLDLHVRDSARTAVRLQQSLEKSGIGVFVDQAAKASLQGSGNRDFLVYFENVSPEEVAALLGRLHDDAATSVSAETLTVHTMSAEDRKLLAGLMGVEASKFDPPVQDSMLLETFIEGPAQKGKKTPDGPVTPQRHAVVLLASSQAHDSPDVKNFLEQRRAGQPGTMQVLVVLHQSPA